MKGPLDESIPHDLRAGLRLHRRIDTISNHLPEIRCAYHRFGPELRRIAPVLLDLVADHVFANHWSALSRSSLQSFTYYCYRTLNLFELPPNAKVFVKRMVESDLLAGYGDRAVAYCAMQHVLARVGVADLSIHLEDLLETKKEELEGDFFQYFPKLEHQVAGWIDTVGLLKTLEQSLLGECEPGAQVPEHDWTVPLSSLGEVAPEAAKQRTSRTVGAHLTLSWRAFSNQTFSLSRPSSSILLTCSSKWSIIVFNHSNSCGDSSPVIARSYLSASGATFE